MNTKNPLNARAVEFANARLWKENPELGGRMITLDPADDVYRRRWLTAYREALAKRRPMPTTSTGKVGAPLPHCPSAARSFDDIPRHRSS